MSTGERAVLCRRVTFGGRAISLGHPRSRSPQLLHFVMLLGRRDQVDDGVFGRNHCVGHSEARIGPRGEDTQSEVVPGYPEVELHALRASDPIALHRLDPLGPVDLLETVEQLVRVLGDRKEPLLQVSLDDDITGTFARAVREDLFVGEHGLTSGAPVDWRVRSVREPGLEHLHEDVLVPVDERGIVAADLTAPVVHGAERYDTGLELRDPVLSERPGVLSRSNSGVFCRQPEGVETEGR